MTTTQRRLINLFGYLWFAMSMILSGQQVHALIVAGGVHVAGTASAAPCSHMSFHPCADLNPSTVDYAPTYRPLDPDQTPES